MKRLLLILILLCAPALAHATDYYVATTGSGSTCSLAAPCLTVAIGMAKLTTPGDTLYIRAGTYHERINTGTQALVSGVPGSPITISAYPGNCGAVTCETVWLDGFVGAGSSTVINMVNVTGVTTNLQYIVFDGINVDGLHVSGGDGAIGTGNDGILSSPNHIIWKNYEVKNTNSTNGLPGGFAPAHIINGTFHEFRNCHIHDNGLTPVPVDGFGGYAFYINGTDHIVDNCHIHDNGGYGLQIFKYNTTHGAERTTVSNSIIHDNSRNSTTTTGGLVIASGAGHVVYNNVIYNNFDGIDVSDCIDCLVYNNTIYNSASRGINISAAATRPLIKNNIVVNSIASGNIANDGASSPTFSTNLCNGSGGSTNCSVTGDPLFVNPGGGNFQLSSLSSQAVNTGTTLPAPYNVDILGVVRPQASVFDIGAYEYTSSTIPVVTITGPTSAATYSTSSASITVSGTSDMVSGIISWSCDRCTPATGSTISGTLNAWTIFPALTLKAGINILTVTGTATAGGASSDTLTITYTPTFPGNGLVLAMPFEDGSGTTVSDTSGNSNTGTAVGTPVWTGTSGGRYGNALTFDGLTQYITVADSNSLDLTQSFSISMWVKSTQANTDYRSLIAKTATPLGPPYRLFASVGGECGAGGISGFTRANGVSGPEDYACQATPLAINVWTHLAFTYDGATLTLYKNGVSIATQVHTGIMEQSTGVLYIGASEFGEYFKGLIDELRVYTYAIPRTALSNTVFGNNCTRADQATTPSVIGDANCPITAPTPPVIIKIGSSATALQIQGTFKLGSTSGAQ
jgi:parallel beta-helix repeat protein